MDVVERQQIEKDESRSSVPVEGSATPRQEEPDPFAGASPIYDLTRIAGGLPDSRDADEILRDLARCRVKRRQR
jgi:hypothetical protein